MLRSLSIRDFVIVDRLDLEFEPGFTVLTGETGAGKSILIDALALVLGERSDAGLVRDGCVARRDRRRVRDRQAAWRRTAWLESNDLADEPGVCLMRRVLEAGGRSRAYVNGRPCTLEQLKELGERLVDIHGQHEHQSLLRPAAQRELLDAYRRCRGAGARSGRKPGANGRSSAPASRVGEERSRRWRPSASSSQWQVQELTQLAFSARNGTDAAGRSWPACARGQPA